MLMFGGVHLRGDMLNALFNVPHVIVEALKLLGLFRYGPVMQFTQSQELSQRQTVSRIEVDSNRIIQEANS